VRLADKATPCFTYRPAFDTLVQAKVTLFGSSNQVVAGPVNGNSLGQYVIPTHFVAGNLTVKADCALPVGPTDLIIGGVDTAKIRALYERYEFKAWLRDLPGAVENGADAAGAIAAKAARDAVGRRFDAPPPPLPAIPQPPLERNYETVLDETALERWIAEHTNPHGATGTLHEALRLVQKPA